MTLGQRIQAHRTRLGLSQEGLGDKLGVSRQAVSKWEADRRGGTRHRQTHRPVQAVRYHFK